jgi:hypothetical protein
MRSLFKNWFTRTSVFVGFTHLAPASAVALAIPPVLTPHGLDHSFAALQK